jgi:phosphotransferase system HPr (HPr) family protein
MSGEPLTKTVVITNPRGLHLRPATKFAQVALRFQSDVRVVRQGEAVNGKSPLEMVSMLSPEGTELTIEVAGPDAREALDALVAVLEAPPPPEDEE